MKISQEISFVYKTREENILRENLVASGLISQEQLADIKKLYHESVVYHNFLHALSVAQNVLKLPTHLYSIQEIQSLFIAALFHDAGHTGTVDTLDEFRSLDLAFQGIVDFERKYNYTGIDYSIVRKAIIGTVFKNRAKNTDPYAILLADLDVASLGMSFPAFLYYCDFPICIEFGKDIKSWLKDVNYFKFLMSVEKHIFRTKILRSIFPETLGNIKKYSALSSDQGEKLFYFWEKNNLTFGEFEEVFLKEFENT